MSKWIHKLLFVIIGLSFFISATEMNIGEAKNTFFDEYDSYVKTEQVCIDHAEMKQLLQQDIWEAFSFIYYYYDSTRGNKSTHKEAYIASSASPPKIYLRNSVWRI